MALVNVRGVSLSFGADLLLDQVNLSIEEGDRISLVGRNGTGKSSLLKLIHGDLSPDQGEIQSHPSVRVAYLPQDVPADMSGLVADVVESAAFRRRHANAHTETHGHQIVGRVLSHLGMDPHADCAVLSGGYKRRVLLASALVQEPDILLLDEPTNHLDIESICWMETFLLRHCKTLLFVTHDRAFLRRTANRIVDLDRGKLADWTCDYDTFLKRKAGLIHDENVSRAVFDKKLAKEEAWIRQGIKARRTRDEGRVRALMSMRETRRARRSAEGQARLQVQQGEASGHKVIQAKGVSFGYGAEALLVKDFSTHISRGDKIGVIGPNGSGKTTLLKLLTGQLTPTQGEVRQGTRLTMAYFDQHRAQLNDQESVAAAVGQGMDTVTIDGKPRHVISYLQDFLFTPDRAKSPVSVLSGGERNRLLLAMLFAQPSNLLVMDEPTNDLDVETLELLEEQLMNYPGTVLMVSHDRAFLDNVVTSVFVMQGSGVVGEYVGGYDDWLKQKAGTAAVRNGTSVSSKPRSPRVPVAFGYKQNRELNALPKKIETLEARQEALHLKMADPDYFRTPPDQLAADRQEEADMTAQLEATYERWEALEALRDQHA
ncbi:MAG: ATP-binding cassette domain-containing protein [Kiritimatiellia bacterium]|jgi:ATP-binding cassette subfamily F protein uup|nr:ATP-binding cassette domain-containing protein [Kiritimatiellia bacterium]MDP6631737.1 ATP-binding cassette domain-containing protein [Kiritimatiellia bacterium]MDP6810509.1 ATP-binding cassette domain-containing protein [Kiritimatiellia bacterium]MDP7024974.1 ATP-binding cassette domain-containing protein [Kiritimatiellia bacterium]